MFGMTAILLGLGGLVAAPYAVAGVNEFIPDTPTWFPYFVVGIFAVILYVVNLLRWMAGGLVAGVLGFGALLAWAPPSWFRFLPDAPAPF